MVVYLAGQTANKPGIGTLTINADGSYVFVPANNFHGVVPVATYAITDGAGGYATADLLITVTSVNENPMLTPDIGSTPENTTLVGNVLTNDTDNDGDTLTVTQFVVEGVTYAAGATATVVGKGTIKLEANGAYTFVPFPYYEGTVPQVIYTASDGHGGVGSTTLDITVTHINHAPQDGDENFNVQQDTPLVVVAPGLLANATDLDGDTLVVASFQVAGQSGPFVIGTGYLIPGVGTITINANGSFTYSPAAGYVGGVPSIFYVVSDGEGGTDTSALYLTMVPIDEDAAPVNPDVPPPVGAPTEWPRSILFPPTDFIGTLDIQTTPAWIEPVAANRWFKIHCWGAAGGSRSAGSATAKGGTGGYTVMYVQNPLATLGRYLRSMVGLGGASNQAGAEFIITTPEPAFGYGGGGAGAGDVDSLPTPCSGGGASALFIGPDAVTGPDDWARLLIIAGGGGGAGGDLNSEGVMAGAGNGGGDKLADMQGQDYPVHPENTLNGRSYGGGGGGYRGGAGGFRTAANGGESGVGGSGYGNPTYGSSIAVFASAAGAALAPNPYAVSQKGNGGDITTGVGQGGLIFIEHN